MNDTTAGASGRVPVPCDGVVAVDGPVEDPGPVAVSVGAPSPGAEAVGEPCVGVPVADGRPEGRDRSVLVAVPTVPTAPEPLSADSGDPGSV
ncbi:MAG: hypothetical protein HOW97_43745, partial [Catenulispora sp.]|nr:hypothetical protein [Catenulispora sp.]